MKQLYPLYFACLLALFSCKKEEDPQGEFEGVVLDYETQKPLSNTKVVFTRGTGISIFDKAKFENAVADSTFTDQNGKYRFTTPIDQTMVIYRVNAKMPGYLQNKEPLVLASLIDYSKHNQDTIVLGRAAYLKVKLKSMATSREQEPFLQIAWETKPGQPSPTSPQMLHIINNRTYSLADTTITQEFIYAQHPQLLLKWSVFQNNETKQYEATVNLKLQDTTTFTINF